MPPLDEDEDTFAVIDGLPDGLGRNLPNVDDDDDEDDDDISVARSVASTALASDVGSRVHNADAFLRSITFMQNETDEPVHWSLILKDPPPPKAGSRFRRNRRRDTRPIVESVGGVVAHSRLQPGDAVRSINGRKIGPSYNAERAMKLMYDCLEEEGYLSVQVGNDEGSDVLVQATIIKPRPEMTYKQLGMVVWFWGTLCIKSIDPESVFHHTVLKETDLLYSINDILLDRVTADGFAHILDRLTNEVTIVVKRGKQRWSGKFG